MSEPAAPSPAPTAPQGSPPASPPPPPAGGPPPAKVEFRNVMVLTMCGVVLVLIFLLISFFLGHAGEPQKEFKTEMQAPNYQTSPQNAPMKTAEWYLRRCREALNRKDFGACQVFLEDLHEQIRQQPNLLSAQDQQDLQDVEDDFAVATGRPHN